jgi:hypothetical protein
MKFRSKEKRDELAECLVALANYMQRSFDQGNHGTIVVDDRMIEDVKAAACVVALSAFEDETMVGLF